MQSISQVKCRSKQGKENGESGSCTHQLALMDTFGSNQCETDRALELANKVSIHGLRKCYRASMGFRMFDGACWAAAALQSAITMSIANLVLSRIRICSINWKM